MVATTMHILTKKETPEITSKLTDSKEGDVIDCSHLLSYTEADTVTRALSTCLATKMNFFQARVNSAILSTMSLAHSPPKNLFLCFYRQHRGEEELSYFFHNEPCTLYIVPVSPGKQKLGFIHLSQLQNDYIKFVYIS
jgi:hypothetical protein